MGLAIYPSDASDPESLIMAADAAMYDAKAAGRDNFQFYRPEMDANVRERLSLQEHLRKAIASNEFELHFQPQVDVRSGLIVGMEALLRWNSPELGVIPPTKFIPLAEATGLIVPIGDWVLTTACRQNKAWQDAGLPSVRVCVNASARQFRERTWVERVEKALTESGLEARYLELEVTESLLLHDYPQSLENMENLRRLGVQLSIDDFGTGYSNLSTLKDYPVARLKIDQSFIRDLPDDRDNCAIVAAVISLAQRLDLRVVAEGVETDGQLEFLRRYACDEIQGDRFCQALPAQAASEFLAIRSGNREDIESPAGAKLA
jgi:EAL domain-containing protein (putative c-di-GMP-specific phosphodiesterase class I)